jgi:hypothetical protein
VNAFLDLAERQTSAPVKARQRAAEQRAANKADKEAANRYEQHRLWRHWRRERIMALLAGPHGEAADALVNFLQHVTLASEGELIERVRCGPWRTADADARFLVLSLIDGAITDLRERDGLVPFDDPLWGEPPTVFQIVREILR